MHPVTLAIEKRLTVPQTKSGTSLGRAGTVSVPHGTIETPAFVTVGTKATVKSLTPEQVHTTGAQVVLANTYHLYLRPGDELIRDAGGLHTFMNWDGPMMTDSGGFQVFSLGAGFDTGASKFARDKSVSMRGKKSKETAAPGLSPAVIDEDGVTFHSHFDGSAHRFTPERSIEIQHNLGADIIFSFDECTAPDASYDYQREAMERTHRWAERGLVYHNNNTDAVRSQGLFGVVQGGQHADLREESAKFLSQLCPPGGGFAGFGIGGSFSKDGLAGVLQTVNAILPEEKPRHLLGIGEPEDLLIGIENGIDFFDCVSPTRLGRTGVLYTARGKINMFNAGHRHDFSPVTEECSCYTCTHYTKAYLAHLFRSGEMLAATLASIHNLHFLINLVAGARQAILDDTFWEFRDTFLDLYRQQDR